MKQDPPIVRSIEQLYQSIQAIIETSRATVFRMVNSSMVMAYWNIGRLIVEEEQKGEQRAEYGKQIIDGLSKRLQKEYGKGYTPTNLKYIRQFYRLFEKSHALRDELSWTHYRLLLKVEEEQSRQFYVEETIASHWNTRTLERQINSLYYERMLMSGKEGRSSIKQQVESKKEEAQPGDIILKTLMLSESKQIFASKYQLYLPTEEELRKELARERQEIVVEKRLQQNEEE